jgi:hypothetical protein
MQSKSLPHGGRHGGEIQHGMSRIQFLIGASELPSIYDHHALNSDIVGELGTLTTPWHEMMSKDTRGQSLPIC